MDRPQAQPEVCDTRKARGFPSVLAYLLLAILFFSPHLLGLTAFAEGDFTRHYLPYSFFQQSSLFAGALPVWNVHVNSGHPFLADTESAVFYPVSNALLLLTGFARSITGRLYWLQVEALVHVVLACSFCGLLVSRLTGRRLAGFASGLLFGFSGYLTGYPLVQIGILRVAVWLPLILWLLLPDAAGPPRWRRWLLAAAVHAVAFFANHPQTFLFLTYAVGGWMLALALSDLRGGRAGRARLHPPARLPVLDFSRTLRLAAAASLYAATLVLLTAAQLWPALEFTELSVRSARPYQELSSGFPLQDIWQLLLHGVLSQYSPLYLGIAGLGLAAVAVGSLLTSRFRPGERAHSFARPAAVYFVACGGVALLVSFGDALPIYPLLYSFAPGWDLFRGQERVAYLFAFSLSVLAGLGLAILPSLTLRWRQALSRSYLSVVAAGLGFFALVARAWFPLESTRGHLFFALGVSLLVALLFARLCAAPRVSRTRLILLLPLMLAELHLAGFLTNAASGPEVRAAITRPELAATAGLASSLAAETEGLAPRVYNELRLPEDSGIVAGWEDVWAASVLRLAEYNTFFLQFPMERMWQLTGVGTVLSWREELPAASRLEQEFPLAGEANRLHRLEEVAPRLWWTQRARRVVNRAAAPLLADAGFDLQSELLVHPQHAHALGDGWRDDRLVLGEEGKAALDVTRRGPAHYLIEIASDQPGLLFASENWMPGWRALWRSKIEGSRPAALPVARVHMAFLGIRVPAGDGELELVYRPASVRWGLAVSGLAWLALVVAFRVPLSRRFRRTAGAAQAFMRSGPESLARALRGGRKNVAAATSSAAAPHRANLRSIGFPESATIRLAVLALVTLFGFALRLFRLGFQELSPPEAAAYNLAALHWDELAGVAQGILLGPHAIGGLAAQRAWLFLTGSSEFALRSFSALAGTAAIPLVYVLARRLCLSRTAALVSSLLMAVSAPAIWHSQDAQASALTLALTTSSTVLALIFFAARGGRATGIAYVLCTVAALYANPFAVLILLAQNLYLLFLAVRAGRFRPAAGAAPLSRSLAGGWLWAQAAVAALALPLFVLRWQIFASGGAGLDGGNLAAMLIRGAGLLALGKSVPHELWQFDAGLIAAAVLAAGVLANGVGRTGSLKPPPSGPTGDEEGIGQGAGRAQEAGPGSVNSYPSVLLLLYLLLPLLGPWISGGSVPALMERFTVSALTPLVILLSAACEKIGKFMDRSLGWRWREWTAEPGSSSESWLINFPLGRVACLGLISLFLAGNLFSLRNHYFVPDFSKSRGMRDLAGRMEQWGKGLSPDELQSVPGFFADPSIVYYHPDSVPFVYPNATGGLASALAVAESLPDRGITRVLLPVSARGDAQMERSALEALSRNYNQAAATTTGDWTLYLFSRPEPGSWRPLDIPFVNQLTLKGVQVEPDFPPAGGRLVVHIEWEGELSALTGGEKLFLHLVDASGNLLAQWDPGLAMTESPQLSSYAMPVPRDLPPGSLRLLGGLYDVSIEGAPRITTETGEDSLLLVDFSETACDGCDR